MAERLKKDNRRRGLRRRAFLNEIGRLARRQHHHRRLLQRYLAGHPGLIDSRVPDAVGNEAVKKKRPARSPDGPHIQQVSSTLARRQHHHDLASLELGVLLDLGEFGDIGLHLVE